MPWDDSPGDPFGPFGLGGRLAVLLLPGSIAWLASLAPGRRPRWRPLAWALLSVAAAVAALVATWAQWIDGRWGVPGPGGLLVCAVWPGVLLAAWMAARGPGPLRGWQWGVAVGACVAGLGWMHAPLCAVALTGFVLGRWSEDRPAQAVSVLLGLIGLALYYFDAVSGTLLDKAMRLGLAALWLAALAVWLAAPWRRTDRMSATAARGWRLPLGLVAGGVLVLGGVQFQVHRYETILSRGRPVILALAPVDPRSLMQGDYMALDYAVRRQAEDGVRAQGPVRAALAASGHGWLWLRPDAQGVGQLVAVTAVTPEVPDAVKAGTVALAFHWRDERIDWGARSWFFPEGQGERYAQARYGVLRVAADGTALLAGLLDGQLAPLQAGGPSHGS
jgi:uncharacterized membrane-anchored protein